MKQHIALLWLILPLFAIAQPKIQLQDFAGGFDLPVDIASCGDSRIFVVERDGVIWVLDSLGNRLDTFLNIDPRVNSGQNEQGLLGLAFHPNYAQNGYFFVNYTKNNGGDTRVARFSVRPNNPNEADPNSELTILEQDQPNWNHNGGCVKFGPDGYLYTGLGDGGGANDPQNYSQNKKNLLGKILRIDVNNSSASQPYVVPSDNPFVGNSDYLPEIWSLGWRNPWRFSFDRLTGDMWIGDVGQNLWEEVDFEPANTPGLNYGWRCYEGTHAFNTAGCQAASSYVSPFFDYSHSGANGCSVTGGFIYRGSKYPDLYGCYLFSDYCSGRWWYSKRNADGTITTNILANLGGYEFSTYGEDNKGELYVALLSSGKIQKIKEMCSAFQIGLNNIIDSSCTNAGSGYISLSTSGGAPFLNYTWSNNASGGINENLNPGIYTVEVKDGNNCIRRDTFEIRNISPDAPQIFANDTSICAGNSVYVELSALPAGYFYEWFENGIPINPSGPFLSPSANAQYQVRVSNGLSCVSEFSIPLQVNVLANPVVTLTAEGALITASSSPSNAVIQWFYEGTPIPNENGNTLLAEQSGFYTVSVTDSTGCTSSTGISVIGTSLKLPETVRNFSINPNPTENRIVIELELGESSTVVFVLTDNSQRQLFAQTQNAQKFSLPFDLSAYPAGTYFLSIKMGSEIFVRKVLKQ